MRNDPRKDDDAYSYEAPVHSQMREIIRTHDNVIHVSDKTRHHDEGHVNDEEGDEAQHREKMNGARRLPPSEKLRVPWKMIHHRGRHREPAQKRGHPKHENGREVSDLLESIVAIESVGLRRQMKRGVVNPRAPGLQKNGRGGRNDPPPLLG